ncbi:hypothetical protein CDAR_519581 [Caerostris darwini]|uniref:Uncharacterized protein n=1 Tax=Caerostris darwini TaxID=1538125 RepID=A0AAV4TQ46_9ARAC|nr:hypothetical protein CDAR_519581 [Caerostris darwini]
MTLRVLEGRERGKRNLTRGFSGGNLTDDTKYSYMAQSSHFRKSVMSTHAAIEHGIVSSPYAGCHLTSGFIMLVLVLFYTAFIRHILYQCKNQCFKGRFALTAIKQPRPQSTGSPLEASRVWKHLCGSRRFRRCLAPSIRVFMFFGRGFFCRESLVSFGCEEVGDSPIVLVEHGF